MAGQNGNEPIVEVKNVVKSFPMGDIEIAILKGISLQVHEGELVSIVGPSGSGKSTLLNMITGIDRPSAGEVVVAGHPWRKCGHHLSVLPDVARADAAQERHSADGLGW
jgi:putative ABC transport system ATP-binding protein